MASHCLGGDESICFDGVSSSIGQDSPKYCSAEILHPAGLKSCVLISSQTASIAVNYFKLSAASS